ncbi:MAG: ROK family protein [Acidimicrobiales bacterium]
MTIDGPHDRAERGPTGPALAIDVGGTKLAAAIVGPDGTIVDRRSVPTDAAGRDGEQLYGALIDLVREVRAAQAARGGAAPVVCGVGTGGPMTRGGEAISPMNIGGWRDFPLRGRLLASLGLPVFVDNDAKALALGEGWIGGAVGVPDYLAMVVSTGVGGGIVLDGRLLDGRDGNAGHIGHMTVEPDGHLCRCGNRGCLEAEASGTGIAAITGRPAAEAGPEVVERVGTLVGRAVASVATLLDLRLALVAGSVALGYGEPFFAAAQAEIDRRARLDYVVGATISPGALADRGPLVGAAAVGFRGLRLSAPPPA